MLNQSTLSIPSPLVVLELARYPEVVLGLAAAAQIFSHRLQTLDDSGGIYLKLIQIVFFPNPSDLMMKRTAMEK